MLKVKAATGSTIPYPTLLSTPAGGLCADCTIRLIT
jgi:hypothetical protein